MEAKRKSKLNFLIEGLTLLVLMLMIATGLIMEFRLPPGSGGEGAALHGGMGRTALTLAGVSRHQWGTVHFYLAMSMLTLIAWHLWLHWRWIWAIAQGSDPARRRLRGRVFLAASVFFLALSGTPWMVPTVGVSPSGAEQLAQTDLSPVSDNEPRLAFPVNGRTTLHEVALATGASLPDVAACLKLTGSVSGAERLGPLSRRLGINMTEARARLGLLPNSRLSTTTDGNSKLGNK